MLLGFQQLNLCIFLLSIGFHFFNEFCCWAFSFCSAAYFFNKSCSLLLMRLICTSNLFHYFWFLLRSLFFILADDLLHKRIDLSICECFCFIQESETYRHGFFAAAEFFAFKMSNSCTDFKAFIPADEANFLFERRLFFFYPPQLGGLSPRPGISTALCTQQVSG